MKISSGQIEYFINKIHQEKIAGCLVFGPEQTLVNYRANLIAKKICPDLKDPFLVTNISKEKISENPSILSDEFFSYSMLGGRKLIIINSSDASTSSCLKNLFEDKEYAKKSDNFILIQAGDLDKSSSLRKICEENYSFAAIACYEDNDYTIKKFIADELSKNNASFNAEVVNFIFSKTDKNRQIILSEINKAMLYLGDRKSLNVETLEKIIGRENESSIDELLQNLSSGNFELSVKNLEKLIKENGEKVSVIRLLSNFFQKLFSCKDDIEAGKISEEEAIKKQKIFFKSEQTFKTLLRKNSKNFLIKILSDLQKIEIQTKTQNPSLDLELSALIKNICSPKTS